MPISDSPRIASRMLERPTRCVVRFGEPILLSRDIDAAGEETARKEIEAALNAVTWQVDEEARR